MQNNAYNPGALPYTVPASGDAAVFCPLGGGTVNAFATPAAGDILAVYAPSDGATEAYQVSWNGKNYQGASGNTVLTAVAYAKLIARFSGTEWR